MAKKKDKKELDPKVESEIDIHIDNSLVMLERQIRRTAILSGLMSKEDSEKLRDSIYKHVLKTTNAAIKKRMKSAILDL